MLGFARLGYSPRCSWFVSRPRPPQSHVAWTTLMSMALRRMPRCVCVIPPLPSELCPPHTLVLGRLSANPSSLSRQCTIPQHLPSQLHQLTKTCLACDPGVRIFLGLTPGVVPVSTLLDGSPSSSPVIHVLDTGTCSAVYGKLSLRWLAAVGCA